MSAINHATGTEDYVGALVLIRDQLAGMLRIGRSGTLPIDEVTGEALERVEAAITELDGAIDAINVDPDIGTPENMGAQNFVDLPRSQRGVE